MVVFGQSGSIRAKAVIFLKVNVLGQGLLYCSCKVVVYKQKWLYSVKSCCNRAKWLYSGRSGCTRKKVVVFDKSGCV